MTNLKKSEGLERIIGFIESQGRPAAGAAKAGERFVNDDGADLSLTLLADASFRRMTKRASPE